MKIYTWTQVSNKKKTKKKRDRKKDKKLISI